MSPGDACVAPATGSRAMTDKATKDSIRSQIRSQRAALNSERQDCAASAVAAQLSEVKVLQTAKTVAGYRSIRGELSIDLVLTELIAKGSSVTVPRVVNEDLEFVEWSPSAPEGLGTFGIPEPSEGRVVDITRHDVVLAPLVAFDHQGQRLGQGKGFYDRCLARIAHKPPFIIGIAYAFQQVAEIPNDSWDIALDAVVTESRVFEFRPGTLQRSISANRPPME